VSRREIAVRRGTTYEALCHATAVLSGTLMTEAVADFASGTLRATPQPAGGPAHRNMPPDRVQAVERKLAEGRWPHFID
jgi:methionyl-tRNA formyltransferase